MSRRLTRRTLLAASVAAPAIAQTERARVLRFVLRVLHRFWRGLSWSVEEINGARGVVVREQGRAVAAVSFAYDASGHATNVFIVRNPEKLARLDAPVRA